MELMRGELPPPLVGVGLWNAQPLRNPFLLPHRRAAEGWLATASQKPTEGQSGVGAERDSALEVGRPSWDLASAAQALGRGTCAGDSSCKWCSGFLAGPGASGN